MIHVSLSVPPSLIPAALTDVNPSTIPLSMACRTVNQGDDQALNIIADRVHTQSRIVLLFGAGVSTSVGLPVSHLIIGPCQLIRITCRIFDL